LRLLKGVAGVAVLKLNTFTGLYFILSYVLKDEAGNILYFAPC